ncbi:hypothetical protein Cal7507_4053 [Calothrix sp. PCC 7507]|nr:hypothetical protein Cal7507_4053 [Calothrix sp. PCC 7507]
MAVRNNMIATLWQKIRQDSVSWGSLALWVSGLVVLLIILTKFSRIPL